MFTGRHQGRTRETSVIVSKPVLDLGTSVICQKHHCSCELAQYFSCTSWMFWKVCCLVRDPKTQARRE
jgi:hypothetical protein